MRGAQPVRAFANWQTDCQRRGRGWQVSLFRHSGVCLLYTSDILLATGEGIDLIPDIQLVLAHVLHNLPVCGCDLRQTRPGRLPKFHGLLIPSLGPAGFDDLPGPGDAEGVCRDVFGDGGPGGDIRPFAPVYRGDEVCLLSTSRCV